MSKNNKTVDKTVEEMPLANPQGKTVEELKEIVQTLQAQKNQHQERASQAQATMNYETTMVTKAQGALEVMLQMIPKEEVEKMIQEETRTNHKETEPSDG